MSKPRVPRTDRATSVWMCVAAACAAITIVARGRIPQNLWTMIHLVTLGVLFERDFPVVLVLHARARTPGPG